VYNKSDNLYNNLIYKYKNITEIFLYIKKKMCLYIIMSDCEIDFECDERRLYQDHNYFFDWNK